MYFSSPVCPNMPLTLHNLLLVPKITKNLISVNKFAQDNNVFFEFHPKFCLVKSQDSSKTLLRGCVGADGLYKFPSAQMSQLCSSSSSSVHCNLSTSCNSDPRSITLNDCTSPCTDVLSNNKIDSALDSACSQFPEINVAALNALPSISNSKYALWHSRLGHPHHHALTEVLKLCHIPIPSKPSGDLCHACCLGKSHRLHAPLSNTVYNHPFELVVCDLWGPVPEKSSGGFTYFLTCVDAYSRFVWVFPLRLKSDTLPQFLQFKTMVENAV